MAPTILRTYGKRTRSMQDDDLYAATKRRRILDSSSPDPVSETQQAANVAQDQSTESETDNLPSPRESACRPGNGRPKSKPNHPWKGRRNGQWLCPYNSSGLSFATSDTWTGNTFMEYQKHDIRIDMFLEPLKTPPEWPGMGRPRKLTSQPPSIEKWLSNTQDASKVDDAKQDDEKKEVIGDGPRPRITDEPTGGLREGKQDSLNRAPRRLQIKTSNSKPTSAHRHRADKEKVRAKVQTTLSLSRSSDLEECKLCNMVYITTEPRDVKFHSRTHAKMLRLYRMEPAEDTRKTKDKDKIVRQAKVDSIAGIDGSRAG